MCYSKTFPSVFLSTHILYSYYCRRMVVLDTLLVISMIIYYAGNFGYFYKLYYNNGKFADVALNFSVLLSVSYGYFVVYTMKTKTNLVDRLIRAIEKNPYLNFKSTKLLPATNMCNTVQKLVIVYCLVFSIIALILVELQSCDFELHQYECGYLLPSVCILIAVFT